MQGDRFKLKFDSPPHPHSGGGWVAGRERREGGSISLIHREARFTCTAFYVGVGGGVPCRQFLSAEDRLNNVGCRLFSLTSFTYNTGATHMTANGNK